MDESDWLCLPLALFLGRQLLGHAYTQTYHGSKSNLKIHHLPILSTNLKHLALVQIT